MSVYGLAGKLSGVSVLLMSGFLVIAATPVSAVSLKTLWIAIANPLNAAGITYQVTDDAVSAAKASEDIQGYATDGTPLGRIGTGFFVFDAAKLGVEIALNGTYDIKELQVANYRSPQVQNDSIKLAILVLIEYSSPQVSLAYATVDVVLLLLTGQALDNWTIESIASAGTYASRFVNSLPTQFAGFESWIQQKAEEVWNSIPQPGGWNICGPALVPPPLVLYASVRRMRKIHQTALEDHALLVGGAVAGENHGRS